MLRSIEASTLIGLRVLLRHAIDDTAKAFYLKHGFVKSRMEPMTLMLGLKTEV